MSRVFFHPPENTGEPNPKQAYLTTEKSIAFVSRQTKAGKPFLLQISQCSGRSEAEAKAETVIDACLTAAALTIKAICKCVRPWSAIGMVGWETAIQVADICKPL